MPTVSRSQIIIEPELKEGDRIPLETCGAILREEYLEPLGIKPYRLAKSIGVPPMYISKILHGGGISAEMGLLLDRYFGMSEGFWSRLQADYDARLAKRRIADKLERVIQYRDAAESSMLSKAA